MSTNSAHEVFVKEASYSNKVIFNLPVRAKKETAALSLEIGNCIEINKPIKAKIKVAVEE